MKNIQHPSAYLKAEWIKIIRQNAVAAEKSGSLTTEQLDLSYREGWFKLFVPKEFTGLEISLTEALKLEEALSWADGSFGWTITLCSGAGWFGGFLDKPFAETIFTDRKVCFGGSGAPTGTATATDGGYRINGKWKYATGATHLTHFTANCLIKKGTETVLDESENPLILPFVFNRDEVEITSDWNTTGLIATSSHSFSVSNLDISKERCMKTDSEKAVTANPIYNYPFLQFAESTLAANISGMAINFIDHCQDIFVNRIEHKKLKEHQQKVLIESLAEAKNKINESRQDFYYATERSWAFFTDRKHATAQSLEEVSLTSRNLASIARQQVDELYPLCGLIAADPKSEINRIWRDIHTASQHTLLALPY
ncbi:acyl-CoA dehydrogenase [Rubrolithibacter danxiaensis]|uniref:acyl-CoA dehydrogenase n=1 Tax=Rubrolithibacter danxiaensis TaxID=3390805 RepID=UPI003BF8D954